MAIPRTKETVAAPAPASRRFVASVIAVLFVPALIIGLATGLGVSAATGLVAGRVSFLVVAVGVAAWLALRTNRLSASRERLSRLERAMATSSRALLKRDVSDPVGTALVALLEGVDASWVFLDSIGQEESDQSGVINTVRDVLRTNGSGEPAGWDLMPWRVPAMVRADLEVGRASEVRPERLDTATAALYRAAQIGSEVVLPISVEGAWVGNVGFSSADPCRKWSDGEQQLLRVGAEMIGVYWERRDAIGRLEELVAAKNEFIASVSHEVRTPLTAVLGFAHELNDSRSKFSEQEQADLISLMAAQSQEVANIVDDLLIAARAETGSIVISPEVVPAKGLIGEVLSSHSGRVDFELAQPDEPQLWADPVRTRQVLRNLLTNADRYGGNNVKVLLKDAGAAVVVEVRDDGAGIPKRLRDHVFQPYGRAHQASTQPASVGLGLSVARKLAQLMEGDLEVFRDNGWTVFSLTLPAAAVAATNGTSRPLRRQSVAAV